MLAVLLNSLAPYISTCDGLLDIAPNSATTRVIDRIGPPRYVRLDLDPGADKRKVDVQASIEALPFAAGSFDVVLCYHVLEHVYNDGLAMQEISRVLSPGGFALVQVPWRRHAPVTDEDPSAPPDERARRFGQADHVRFYGADFETRLGDHGLRGTRFEPHDFLSPTLQETLRIPPYESIWFLRKAIRHDQRVTSPVTKKLSYPLLELIGSAGRAAPVEVLADRDEKLRLAGEALQKAKRETRAARGQLRRLRGRRSVKLALRWDALVRRLTGRFSAT